MSSSIYRSLSWAAAAVAVLVLLAAGCDSRRCIRHSDCPTKGADQFACSYGYCMLVIADAGSMQTPARDQGTPVAPDPVDSGPVCAFFGDCDAGPDGAAADGGEVPEDLHLDAGPIDGGDSGM